MVPENRNYSSAVLSLTARVTFSLGLNVTATNVNSNNGDQLITFLEVMEQSDLECSQDHT